MPAPYTPTSNVIPRPQILTAKALAAVERFSHIEAMSGMALVLAAIAALLWANSSTSLSYEAFWHTRVVLSFGSFSIRESLHFLVNDGLVTIFFLVVEMEIRQEIQDGALSYAEMAILPLGAALGGVLVPAGIYLVYNFGADSAHGWAVPTATDIAFAVGVLALLGKSIPGNLRVFLLALAIVDDIAAIMIIALFYTTSLDFAGLGIAVGGLALVLTMQRMGIGSASLYVSPGVIMWSGLLKLGVHPTLAGVVLGIMAPLKQIRFAEREVLAPFQRVQERLHPWVAFVIMPLFALANAGVSFGGAHFGDAVTAPVVYGVVMALVFGKPIGVVLATFILVRKGLCRYPTSLIGQG